MTTHTYRFLGQIISGVALLTGVTCTVSAMDSGAAAGKNHPAHSAGAMPAGPAAAPAALAASAGAATAPGNHIQSEKDWPVDMWQSVAAQASPKDRKNLKLVSHAAAEGVREWNKLQWAQGHFKERVLHLEKAKDAQDVKSFVAHFIKVSQHITALKVTGLKPEYIDEVVHMLQGLHNLKALDISSNNLGAQGIQKVVVALKHPTNITSLNVRSNWIGPEGAQALVGLTHLTQLDISRNQIGDQGAAHLAALRDLTQLDISWNRIEDQGAAHLANLKNLTELNVSLNRIGVQGAKELANLKNLTELNVSQNQIGDQALNALKFALPHTTVVS